MKKCISAFRHVVWFLTKGKGGGLGVIELLFLQQPSKERTEWLCRKMV